MTTFVVVEFKLGRSLHSVSERKQDVVSSDAGQDNDIADSDVQIKEGEEACAVKKQECSPLPLGLN